MREFFRDPETIAVLLLAAHILVVAIAAVLVSVNRRPSSAIAWVLATIFIPLLGAIAFFLVGYAKLPKGRPEWLHSAVALNNNLGALPMVKGNTAELLPDYKGTFDVMTAEIDSATRYVHVEFYILSLDATTAPFFDALARATGRGVAVRVLSDHLAGLMFPGRKETLKFL